MCKPSMPTPPDPRQTASAQTSQNVSTAIANAHLGNVNQITPWGNQTYQVTGYHQLVDPNHPAYDPSKQPQAQGPHPDSVPYQPTGPNTGSNQVDPQTGAPAGVGGGGEARPASSQTQPASASDDAYAKQLIHASRAVDAGQMTQKEYNALAADLEQQRKNDPQTQADLAARGIYNIPTFTATTTLPKDQQKALDSQFATNKVLSRAAEDQARFMRGYMKEGVDTSGLTDFANAPISQSDMRYSGREGNIRRDGPNWQGQLTRQGGDASGIQSGSLDRDNAQRTFGDTPAINYRNAQGGQIDRGAYKAKLNWNNADGGSIQRQAGRGNEAIDRGAYGGDLTRSYGANDFSADRQRVEGALMGRMDRQFQRDRDALQTRLANQGITPGSEAYKNAMDDQERQINDARMNAVLSAGQEQTRMVGMERDRASFQNQAQAQAYGQDANNIGLRNAARGQNFGQDITSGQFANQAQAQAFGQSAANIDRRNAVQAQDFGQNVTRANLNNAAQQQAYNQDAANLDRRNRNVAQQYAQNQGRAGFYNAAQAQDFSQDLANRNMQNAAQAQNFGQTMANSQFNNAAAGQAFNQGLGTRQFENQAQQQAFNQGRTLTNDFNATQNTLFNQQLASAQQQNAQRSQQLQEQFALRNQPINEISALLRGGQVANPNFSVQQPGSIPTTDYAGLVNANYNQQLQNAQMQNGFNQNLLGGLFGLGAAGITGGMF